MDYQVISKKKLTANVKFYVKNYERLAKLDTITLAEGFRTPLGEVRSLIENEDGTVQVEIDTKVRNEHQIIYVTVEDIVTTMFNTKYMVDVSYKMSDEPVNIIVETISLAEFIVGQDVVILYHDNAKHTTQVYSGIIRKITFVEDHYGDYISLVCKDRTGEDTTYEILLDGTDRAHPINEIDLMLKNNSR